MRPAVRYPLPLGARLRLRHGLTWARPLPGAGEIIRTLRLDAPTLRILAGLLAAYAVAGSLDYAEEQRQEAERHAASAQIAAARLAECLNGTARWLTPNNSGEGFGHTLIECPRALEMRL